MPVYFEFAMFHFVQIMISCENHQQATALLHRLLSVRLVACGQIVKSVESFYHWQGQIRSNQESLLMVKSKAALFDEIVTEVERLHSYEVPEIIAIPLLAVADKYQKWINDEVK